MKVMKNVKKGAKLKANDPVAYNEFMFKHPYYYSVEEFINKFMEDIETGIKYGVLEYYLDDTERRARYDKEIDALIYAHLTSVINRG